jgi:hypothetical protein
MIHEPESTMNAGVPHPNPCNPLGSALFSAAFSGRDKKAFFCAWDAGFSVGHGMDTLIHDTRAVEALSRLAASGISAQELRNAVNFGDGLPDDVRALMMRAAEPPPEPADRG